MTKILLSGVPGGGKTYTGADLQNRYGFLHVDMEEDSHRLAYECMKDPEKFLSRLPVQRDIVMGWGFNPFGCRDAVGQIIAYGFTPVWFDGSRAYFFSTFMKREKGSRVKERDYYMKMAEIIQTDIYDYFPWVRFNPYDLNGNFWCDNTERLLAKVDDRTGHAATCGHSSGDVSPLGLAGSSPASSAGQESISSGAREENGAWWLGNWSA